MITQTPWFDRKFDFNFPVGLFPVIIERLKGAVPRIEHILKTSADKNLTIKPDAVWSVKEQIGHLYDLEELWYGRIEDFLSSQHTLRAADLQNTKTNEADHNKRSAEELLQLFAGARNKLLNKIKDIDEQQAALTSLHPRLQQPMRLIDSLFFVAEHDDHHIAKIRSLLS